MASKNIIMSIFLIGCLFLACNNKKSFTSKTELLDFLKNEDYGYTQKKVVNNLAYELMFKPTDLMIISELENREKTLLDLKSKYADKIYFNLKIRKEGKDILTTKFNNRSSYNTMVNELVFNIGNKIHWITKKRDTIQLLDYVLPRTYGMGNSSNFLLVFPKTKEFFKSNSSTLTIQDIGLGTGEVNFRINHTILINQPKLSL